MLSGLQHVKLKKVSPPKETPKIVDNVDITEHQNLMLDANNEEWESAITEFTFTTYYMNITKDDALALLLANIQRGIDSGSIGNDELDQFLPGNDLELMNMDYTAQLNDLTKRLYEKMKDIGVEDGIFIKTSCRSPKDAPSVGTLLKEKYIERMLTKNDDSIDNKLDSLLWAGVQCLKVKNAKDAIELLCSSDRIRMDMFVVLNPELKDREWNQNLVIRKWVDIEPDMEFRGFVYKQKFTALSQYNHQYVSKRLIDNKKIIQDRIISFWEEYIAPSLKDKEKLQSYIVDFALTGDNFDKVWVVELNPFLTSTSSNLFSWSTDNEVLHNGPFEFRLREKSSRGVLADMDSDWRSILDIPIPQNK